MNRRWTIITLIITTMLLLGLTAFTIVIDPFFVYHEPIKETGYIIDSKIENYLNPGLAKHFEYNAVILGSSMAKNFSTDQIDQVFQTKSIKLTYAAAHALNHKIIMDVVLANKKIDKVFLCLDIFAVTKPFDQTRNTLPQYLYDMNVLTDIEYILNKDVIGRALQVLSSQKENTSIDDAYRWYEWDDDFTLKAVLDYYNHNRKKPHDVLQYEFDMENVEQNMAQNILPIIQQNPQVEFYIIFPPYSVLFWDNAKYYDLLAPYLDAEKYVIEKLLQHSNVQMHYFQTERNIVCDLSLYKDTVHYHPNINSFIIESIAANDYILTDENYLSKLDDIRHLVTTLDVDALIEAY